MSFSSSMFSGGFNEFLDLGLSPLWWVAVSVDVTEALKIPFFFGIFFFFILPIDDETSSDLFETVKI